MPTYKVTIRATITKTLIVDAEDDCLAEEAANEKFCVEPDECVEDYEQDILDIKEVTPEQAEVVRKFIDEDK